MMAELIDRKGLKAETRELLSTAQVSPKGMTALYMALILALNVLDYLAGGENQLVNRSPLGIFVYVLTTLLSAVLSAGFVLYCMTVRRGERAEYLTLFDGFSFVGKIIGLTIVETVFVVLWSMLFVVPGIVAAYRYRFALYNLYEDPGIGIMEALEMSKRQTLGYKSQLFVLDWSYFGWGLLASLPMLVLLVLLYRLLFQILSGLVPDIPTDELIAQAVILPMWAWSLISSVFSLVVGLFYVPNRECVELGYFEIAKRTSGVGWNAEPPRRLEDGTNGGWTGGWGQL